MQRRKEGVQEPMAEKVAEKKLEEHLHLPRHLFFPISSGALITPRAHAQRGVK